MITLASAVSLCASSRPFLVLLLALVSLSCVDEDSRLEPKGDDRVEGSSTGDLEVNGRQDQPATAGDPAPHVPIPNARFPLPGVLTGGQPTREQLVEAAAMGYRTVIDLRLAGELTGWDEPAVVRQLGMAYVRIPVEGAAGLTAENVEKLSSALQASKDGPAIVHCKSGNRVGALLALEAFTLKGMTAQEALDLGKRAGMTRLTAETERRLGFRE